MNDVFGDSLNMFPADSKCRLVFRGIVRNQYFDFFILVLILTSSLMLAAESPFWEPGSLADQAFYMTDIVMTSFFTSNSSFPCISTKSSSFFSALAASSRRPSCSSCESGCVASTPSFTGGPREFLAT